jgi:hypothetical protein
LIDHQACFENNAAPNRARRCPFMTPRDGVTGERPIYFRPATGSWTGMCGEELMTLVLPSE